VEIDPDFTKVDKEMWKLLTQKFYATKYNMESTELIFEKLTIPQWQSEDISQSAFSKIF